MDQWVHHFRTGDTLISIDRRNVREEYGAPYLQLHRADLHGELVARVAAHDRAHIQLGHELIGLEPSPAGVRLDFAGRASSAADVVVGADGLRSAVRTAVFGESEPHFTGHIAWRGLVPGEGLSAELTEPASHTWAGPGRLLVHYPIRERGLVNYVGFTRSESWADEGWSIPASVAVLAEKLEGFHPRVLDLLAQTPTQQCFKWGLFAREPMQAWSCGSVTLLGDAAHPMLPYFGLGAGMAIEDAVVFARVMEDSASVAHAFERYERARLERTAFIQKEANLGGERLQQTDTEALAKHKPRSEDTLGVFHYDAATVDV